METDLLSEYPQSVTSDGRIINGAVRNVVSTTTGLVTNELGARHVLADFYRDDYALNDSSPDSDMVVFGEGSSLTMSKSVVDFILSEWQPPSRPRILDVGCGKGLILREFAMLDMSACLTGVEPSERARRQLADDPVLTTVCVTSLEKITASGNGYDLIIINGVLEHVANPVLFLNTLRSLLNRDGMLFVGVPNFESNPIDLITYDHMTRFTAYTLNALLPTTDLTPVRVSAELTRVPMWWMLKPVSDNSRYSAEMPFSNSNDVDRELNKAKRNQKWLDHSLIATRDAVNAAMVEERPILVYGTANLWPGMLALGMCAESDATSIIDDNQSYWNTIRWGHRIQPPELGFELARGCPLVVISANPCYFEAISLRIRQLTNSKATIVGARPPEPSVFDQHK
jgi:SAM-dependent methyltransferase